MDSDLLLAIKLQEKFNAESKEEKQNKKREAESPKKSSSLVSPSWEILDPNPDIYNLFQLFNNKFFWNKLGSVEVKWSKRMYMCAGTTTYKGLAGCLITLSLPLLKLRPRKDLVETLLHEMIHAYLFVADKNRERGEHGPKFHEHMYRINGIAGTNITVYHSFHDEVKHYKQHWWRCNGPCRFRSPYFGFVKRSMNRPPGPNDFWFADHNKTCDGEFIKVKEPEGFKSRTTGNNPSGKKSSGTLFPKEALKSKSATNMNNDSNNAYKDKAGKSGSVHSSNGSLKSNKSKGTLQTLDNFLSPKEPLKSQTAISINSDSNNTYKAGKSSSVHSFNGSSKSDKSKGDNSKFFVKNGSSNLLLGFLSNLHNDILVEKISTATSKEPKLSTSQELNRKPSQNSNIAGFSSRNENSNSSVEKFGRTNNVHGFSGGALSRPSCSSTTSSKKGTAFSTGLMSNRGGTFVEKPRTAPTSVKTTSDKVNDHQKTQSQAFTGQGHVLDPHCQPSEINRCNSRLLKLFQTQPSTSKTENPPKKPRLNDDESVISLLEDDNDNIVNCPVCNKQLPVHQDMNEHLDECMSLNALMLSIDENMILELDDDDGGGNVTSLEEEGEILDLVKCPICDLKCSNSTINSHLDECLQKS